MNIAWHCTDLHEVSLEQLDHALLLTIASNSCYLLFSCSMHLKTDAWNYNLLMGKILRFDA